MCKYIYNYIYKYNLILLYTMFKNKYLKYKQKYLNLKHQIGGAKFVKENKTLNSGASAGSESARAESGTDTNIISLPLHQKCADCYFKKSCSDTHLQFTIECTPYTDVTVGKYNIVNWDNNYIYYNEDNEGNTIRMTKSFDFIPVDNSGELVNFRKPVSNDYLDNYINYELNEIPLYYMYVNVNNNIFNLFCYSCNLSELDNLQISYDKKINKFVKFKSKFNIFSVSLLCNNFFDVIQLFLNPNLNITDKLSELFKDFAIEKLYYQSIYKENFNILKKKENKEYLNDKFFSEEINNKILTNKYDIVDRKKIIDKLKNQIEIYKRNFSKLNKIIPNFDKIYIMSILYYRLIKTTNINSSWNFDTHYIHRLIESSKVHTLDKKIFDIYLDDALVLYDNNEEISFKNEKYRCCMENTLLQFLKVLFWDKNTETYNFTNINEIIKDELKEIIKDFFIKINNELTNKFISDWTIFVTELSNEYIFNRKEAELFPDINNLIIFLKNIIKPEYYNIDNQVFLSNIIHKINSDYTINYYIKSPEQTDINIVTYKEFKIILTPQHAYFENSRLNSNNINILTNIQKSYKTLSNYLYNNLSLCLVDIDSFILFLSISLKNLDNSNKLIIEKYLNNINNKTNIYLNFFHDNIIPNINDEILLSLLENSEVYSTWDKQDIFGNTVWYYAANSVKIDSFWNQVIDKGLYALWNIQNMYGDSVWFPAAYNIKSENFWDLVIEKGLYASWDIPNNNDDSAWSIAAESITSDSFWDKVIDKNLCGSWDKPNKKGDTVWYFAVLNIKSESIWNKVIDNGLCSSWVVQNNYNNTVWTFAVQNIKSEYFWNQVIKLKLYESWNIHNNYNDNVWHFAIQHIKSYSFWNAVIDKNLCGSWVVQNNNGDTVWHLAVLNIKSESLWNQVIDKNLCVSWDKPNNNGDNVWHFAIENIKFESFWNKVIIKKGLTASWDKYNDKNGTVWHFAVQYIKSKSFWDQVINNGLYVSWDIQNSNGDNETLWHFAVQYIDSESFWDKVINNGLYVSWGIQNSNGQNVWHFAVQYIDLESFWNKVIYLKLKIFESWNIPDNEDETVWHIAVKYINSESFWDKVIDRGLCSSWDKPLSINDDTVWFFAVQNIYSESFWNKVIDKGLCSSWKNITINNDNNIWHFAVQYIKSESFWLQVINKGLCSSWDNTIWYIAVQHIKSESFWLQVIDKNLCSSWKDTLTNSDSDSDSDNDSDRYNYNKRNNKHNNNNIWFYALQNIKSETFWDKVHKKGLY